jgi:hypothetical protein
VGDDEPNPGCVQPIAQRQVPQPLSRGELVEPHSFHEPISGVNRRYPSIGVAQLPGGALRRGQAGVSGAQDHDAVRHRSPLRVVAL